MNYALFVSLTQGVGLGLIGGCAVALLRLVLVHFVQRDWTPGQARSLQVLTAMQATGLLFFAFSGGGLLATHFFETNTLPPLPVFAAEAVLMAVMASAVIFLHVVARPWLAQESREPHMALPLVMTVSAHRLLAMALAFAALSSAWTLWLVQAGAGQEVPPPAATLAAMAFLTLAVWAVLAVPALALRALAVHGSPDQDQQDSVPARVVPFIPGVPQHRPVHVPAPRAPRPRLMTEQGDVTG